MRRLLLAAALLLAAPAALPEPALAQDDWSVERDPFDRRLIGRYKRILAKNPGDRGALGKLTRLYRRHRSVALLVSEYEKQLAAKPDDFSALVVLAHLHLGEGKRDEAIALYEKAAAARPKSALVHGALGKLHREGGDLPRARASYDAALAAATKPAQKKEILRALADLALAQDDVDAAKGYYEAYLALDPKDVRTRIELGDALARSGRHEQAIETFEAAEKRLRTDPAQRVEVIARIGATRAAAGDEEGAVRAYRRAIELSGRGYYLRRELTERIVEIHRQRQDLGALLTQYEKEWPAGRRGHFEWDVLARLYEETGQAEKAIEAYRHAVKKAPHELDTQRRLITLLENSGREAEAVRQYEAVSRVAPGEPRFQLELARRYWKAGDEAKALALARKIERHFAADPGVHATLAELYARWGKEDAALAAHERLARIEPDEPRHLVNLGEQYFQRDQKRKARQIWKRILRVKSAENHARLGQVYAEHDMLDDALTMYDQAIALEPKQAEHYKGRGAVYERQRRWPEAIADWDQVLALTPDKAAREAERREARRRVVHLLERAGGSALSERVQRWQSAFDADPPDLNAGYYLVEAHLRKDRSAEARAVLEGILALRPGDTSAMHQLVKVYRAERDYDQAIALLEKLAELSPGRERDYFNQIAEIKTLLHQDDEAIRYAQKALEKSPDDPLAHQRLAERYQAMQEYEQAIAAYEKTIELSPRNFQSYFELARLYLNRDELPKAAALYRELLRRSSDEEILFKAGREAIELEELTGTLGELEKVLSPQAASFGHKPVYRRVLVELYGRYVPALVARAEGGDAEASAELERLGSRGLKPLLEALADEGDVAQQRIAVATLGHLGNRAAAAPLVRLARKPIDADDRRRARIGTLLPTLGWDVRVEALVAAGRLGDARLISELAELAGHREVAMREAAVFALGVTADGKALAPLVRALGDARSSVQTLACLGLARVGGARALGQLGDAVRDERRADTTRAACAYALGSLGDARAAKALAETLEHGNDQAQRLAAWALGRVGGKEVVPALLGAYFTKRAPVRDAVAWALPQAASGDRRPASRPAPAFPMRNGKLDEDALVRGLVGALEAPPLPASVIVGHERELAASIRAALGRHRDLVLRLLADLDARDEGLGLGPLTRAPDAGGAQRTRRALDTIGRALASDVAGLTSHRDPEVRRRALSVVAKIAEPPVARPALASGLADDLPAVREAAMLAAARYVSLHGDRDGDLAGAVSSRLASASWRERVAAARALGHFGDRADPGPLARAATSDPKSFVREAAVRALARAGHRDGATLEALGAAVDAEREPVIAVRVAAARALRALDSPEARGALERAAADPSPRVRRAARKN